MVIMTDEPDHVTTVGSAMPETRCHIKRPRDDRRSNAYGPALCGPWPGCVYVTLGRDDQIPEKDFPVCIPCAERHIAEHYDAVSPARTPSEV